ncbi:transcription elongation factor spt5 [Tilletia horrida]|nr:transcription elongation factor spt5 [Tilletia horrida]KAK0532126.1 transcription elongation factor spt5 [Tilletia horrida]KAK0566919.1 transcription elongation factor spt5 [Tilletia horrida]
MAGADDNQRRVEDDEEEQEEMDEAEIERRIAELSGSEDEDDEDEDEDEDDDDDDEEVGGRRRKQKRARNRYIDVEAEVDDSDEEVEDEEDGYGAEDGFIDQEDIDDNDAFRRRAAADNEHLDRLRRQTENQSAEEVARDLRKRYGRMARRKDTSTSDNVPRQALMPDINDPSLWAVPVKIGREREIVITLMRKAFDDTTHGRPSMAICSAFCRDSIPGKIYVEARRPDSVVDAVAQITGVYGRSVEKLFLVPIEEMADLLKLTKIEHEVKMGGWVRFKRGKYQGDLAQVIDISQNGEEIGIKFVPRIDMNPSEQDYIQDARGVKRRRNLGSGVNALNKRPQQRLFVPTEILRVYPNSLMKRGEIYKFQNEDYRNGYCEKDVKTTALITEDVQPTLAEIEMFQRGRAEVDEDGNPIDDVDMRQLAMLKQKANQVVIQPGDHVEVFEGEQRGVRGTVEAINGEVIIINMELEDMSGTKVEVQLDQVRKTFKPGDHVKVGSGDRIDETGMVVKVEGDTTTFLSDLTMKEVTVFSKDLREAAEVGSGLATVAGFNTHDLVLCNHRAAVIFNIEREGFRILDEDGNTHLVPPRSLLLLKNQFSVCIDNEGHEIRKGDTMKETEGDSPRSGKVIQTYQSGVVFLFNRDIAENNGVWIASPHRLTPLTPRHMGSSVKESLDKMNPAMNMQLMQSRGIDPHSVASVALGGRTKDVFKGRHVSVMKGPFKGCRGIIKETLPDGKARVELHTVNRNETFPLALLKEKDPHTGQTRPLTISGGPGPRFGGPGSGRSSMGTPYSAAPNGPMGPPGMPGVGMRMPFGGPGSNGMGGGATTYGGAIGGGSTTYGGAMGGGATSYGGAMGGGATSYGGAMGGGATVYGGQTAYGNMAAGGKTPAYYTNQGGDQVPAYGVNHGRTPAAGGFGARTPFGAGMGNDGGRTPFSAPGNVTAFAGPGRSLGNATPRAAAAAYGGSTPSWSSGHKTPGHQANAGWGGQAAGGAATPFHAGGGGSGGQGDVPQVADPRRRAQIGAATPNPYYTAPTPSAAPTPGPHAAPTPGGPTPAAAPTPAGAPTPMAAPTPGTWNAPTPGGDGAPTPGYNSAATPAANRGPAYGGSSSAGSGKVYPVRDAAVRILRNANAALVGKIAIVRSPAKGEEPTDTCVVEVNGEKDGMTELSVDDVEIIHPTRPRELCVVLFGESRGLRGTVQEEQSGSGYCVVKLAPNNAMREFAKTHLATVGS